MADLGAIGRRRAGRSTRSNLVKEAGRDVATNERHYSVYIIQLDPTVLEKKKFREANPNHNPKRPCLYVGMTGKTPDERFQQHKAGIKANRYVKEYGKWLRRKMYKEFNPMTYEEAVAKEIDLAEELRRKGYAVWQN